MKSEKDRKEHELYLKYHKLKSKFGQLTEELKSTKEQLREDKDIGLRAVNECKRTEREKGHLKLQELAQVHKAEMKKTKQDFMEKVMIFSSEKDKLFSKCKELQTRNCKLESAL